MKQLRKFLLRNRIAPKWAVFGLDMLIASFAIIYANYLRFNFDFSLIQTADIVDDLVIVTITNSVLFYIFKTYHGIIRFSGFQEAFRSVAAIFYSFFIMLLLNITLGSLKLVQFTPISVLFIYFFIASFLLFGYRLLVKHLYNISINHEDNTYVVIY